MKKVLLIFGVLLSLGMFCACSSDDEVIERSDGSTPTRGIDTLESVKMSSVDSFLKIKILNTMNHNYNMGYFSMGQDMCYRIDSMEELAALYQGEDELPEIDFNNHTLLLGTKEYTNPDTDEENYIPVLVESKDGYTLYLNCSHLGEGWVHTNQYPWLLYYYGFYPKLKDKDITVNLIYK